MSSGVDNVALPAVEPIADEGTRELLRRRSRRLGGRGWLMRRALLAADLVGLTIAFLLAHVLTVAADPTVDRVGLPAELLVFLASLPAWIVVAKLYDLYVRDEERADHSTADDLVGVFHLVTLGTWVFFAATWLTGIAHPQLSRSVVFWFVAIGLVTGLRAGARVVCRRQPEYVQKTVIVGSGEVAGRVARKLLNHPEYGLDLVGVVDGRPAGTVDGGAVALGPPSALPALIETLDVERVIVAFPDEPEENVRDLIRALKQHVQVDLVPQYFQLIGPGMGIHTVEGLPLLGLPPHRLPASSLFLKRAMDLFVSSVALLFLAPLFALVALAIKLDSRGPVLFRQVRMGARTKPFRIMKFRTMVADAEELKAGVAHLNAHACEGGDPRMFKIENDPRVTRVGRFLRRFAIDELPQLVNVLRGEMSLVGPRPLIPDEDREVREWGRRRLDLKPGMTGLWQVLGSSRIGFEEMVNLDYFYVTSWSLWTDLRLLLRTIPLVLVGRNGLE